VSNTGTNPHLTPNEARAVLSLSASDEWPIFKDYMIRLNGISTKACRTAKEDQRFYQGSDLTLTELVRIEEKAKNILGGS
jgi:hypothetical protein